jgi:hypothetical protein
MNPFVDPAAGQGAVGGHDRLVGQYDAEGLHGLIIPRFLVFGKEKR